MSDLLAVGRPLMVEVELFQRFAGGEPGCADTAFTAVGLAGGDLPLKAGGQELLMTPGLCRGPFDQTGNSGGQRRCFQRPSEERQFRGHLTMSFWSPSHHRLQIAGVEDAVVAGQVPLLHRCLLRWFGVDVLAQDCSGGAMTRAGDGLVFGPAKIMSGHRDAGRGDGYLLEVGGDVDPAADHRRMHRQTLRPAQPANSAQSSTLNTSSCSR
ncbi:hypothetical protein HDA40_001995 [Hamadaea flava]|nr:hypothetical protein [Hamadaea flava]